MKVILETYLMKVILETFLMKVILETYLMKVIPERTWWRWFQKRVMCTKFDIHFLLLLKDKMIVT
jgi:hypothetical protein